MNRARSTIARFGSGALTIAAGPAMNILFALLLTVGVLVGYGDYVPEIVAVEADSPAAAAGLQGRRPHCPHQREAHRFQHGI